MASRREAWTPPPRPDWVARINEEGRHLDISAIVPLDPASLIASAKANTGLSDFGAEPWSEAFERFARSVDEQGALNLMGRIMTRSDLLTMLESRLRIEQAYRQHPEIEHEELAPVMLITGQGRTGTSLLLNLLSLDPANATLRTWEAMMPAPPPQAATYETDPRIAICHARISMWERVTPELRGIAEFTGSVPTETGHLERLSFHSAPWLDTMGQAPDFRAWLATQSFAPALQYLKRTLKLLQWRNPRSRWIIKSPDALDNLPDYFATFPGMALTWTHRDPVSALRSMVNAAGALVWSRSDRVAPEGAFELLTNPALTANRLTRPIDWLQAGEIPADRLLNVRYTDLVDNPMATVQALYASFGWPFTDLIRARVARYLADHPRTARPPNVYAATETYATEERRAFARYQAFFGVESES